MAMLDKRIARLLMLVSRMYEGDVRERLEPLQATLAEYDGKVLDDESAATVKTLLDEEAPLLETVRMLLDAQAACSEVMNAKEEPCTSDEPQY